MKQKGIIIFIIIILLGGVSYFLSQNFDPSKDSSISPTPDYDQIAQLTMAAGYPSVTPSSADAGQYIVHSKNVLDNVKGKKVVLFFFANWCSTCRPADAAFTKNVSTLPSGVVVIRVNYNDSDTDQDEKDLAKKYNIVYQHTFVQIDENGNAITRWNGGNQVDLLENIK